MRNLFIFPFLFFTACSLLKPNEIIESNQEQALKYSKQISKQDLFKDLSVLASDSLEGRETATKGQKKAAEYIKNHFIKNNIKSVFDTSYYQQFEVNVVDFTNVSLKINNNDFEITGELFSIDGKKRYYKKIKDKTSNYLNASTELGNYLKLEAKDTYKT